MAEGYARRVRGCMGELRRNQRLIADSVQYSVALTHEKGLAAYLLGEPAVKECAPTSRRPRRAQ
jgi:hypothetical protein